MKKAIVLSILTSSLLLTSCSSVKNANAIYCPMTSGNEVIELTAKSVDYMIDNQYSFILLLYTSSCGICTDVKMVLNQYVKESHYTFYMIEMNEIVKQYLSQEHNEYFGIDASYPLLYIFDRGKLTYKADSNTMENYTVFSRAIRPQLIDTTIYVTTDLKAYYSAYLSDEKCLIYTFDSTDSNNHDLYESLIYNKVINTGKKVLIIDKNTAKDDLFSYISAHFEYGWSSLSISENEQIKTTLGYNSASGNEIDNLLNSFFDLDSIHSSR